MLRIICIFFTIILQNIAMLTLNQHLTLENVKGEFKSFGKMPSERETGIDNRNSPRDRHR